MNAIVNGIQKEVLLDFYKGKTKINKISIHYLSYLSLSPVNIILYYILPFYLGYLCMGLSQLLRIFGQGISLTVFENANQILIITF